MIEQIIAFILNALKSIGQTIWNTIFGNVNFSVLWSWLPSDIGAACASLISILFILACIKFVKELLPI